MNVVYLLFQILDFASGTLTPIDHITTVRQWLLVNIVHSILSDVGLTQWHTDVNTNGSYYYSNAVVVSKHSTFYSFRSGCTVVH